MTPMPKNDETAFKHWISKDLLSRISRAIGAVHPKFNRTSFEAIAPRLAPLELKARVHLVRDQLKAELPEEFPEAIKILLLSLEGGTLKSFDLWPYTEFVQSYGLKHLNLSLHAMEELTQLFTAEFAVRPFLRIHEKKTLEHLVRCAKSKNVHLRRWASEGSRPRLPWGERLDAFVSHPKRTFPILELLKHDSELYVRKSVANHLNDITKDHPQLVIDLLKKWKKSASAEYQERINWIIHRALRSEIKAGTPEALELIGVSTKASLELKRFAINSKQFHMNEKIEMDIEIRSKSKQAQKLVIDYIVHFARAGGKSSAKVFKLKNATLPGQETLSIQKVHHLKAVSTRKHYPGDHAIELQINGKRLKRIAWILQDQ